MNKKCFIRFLGKPKFNAVLVVMQIQVQSTVNGKELQKQEVLTVVIVILRQALLLFDYIFFYYKYSINN